MLNQVVLMGRLTFDPELRTTPSGRNVCSFSIAIDRGYVKQGEERQTDFIRCTAWESTANFICNYFHKGSMIAVTGRLQSSTFDDKQTGAKRTSIDVVVREASFCGSKAETNSGVPAYQTAPAQAQVQAPVYQTSVQSDFEEISDDEDLPF